MLYVLILHKPINGRILSLPTIINSWWYVVNFCSLLFFIIFYRNVKVCLLPNNTPNEAMSTLSCII